MRTHAFAVSNTSAPLQNKGTEGFTSPHSHALISAVEAAPAPSAYPVQMRLPSVATSAKNHASDQAIGRNHNAGLRRLNARIYYHECTPTQQGEIRQSLALEGLTIDDWRDMKPATNAHDQQANDDIEEIMASILANKFPQKIAPDQESVAMPDMKSAEFAKYDSLVKRVFTTFQGMEKSGGLFVEVFGSKAKEAMERLNAAFRAFDQLVRNNRLMWDASGSMEEMSVGGQTGHQASIMLKSIAGVVYTDSAEQAATIIHEMMHHTHAAILDAGGYPDQKEFKTQSEAVKLVNAAHYEEVARRILGIAAVGGTFTPAVQSVATASGMVEVDSRTPAQKAAETFRARIRTAWTCAQNLRNFLNYASYPDRFQQVLLIPQQLRALTAINDVFQLGLPKASNSVTAAPTQTDVLQIESITKSLALMMQADVSAAFDAKGFTDNDTAFAAARNLLAAQFADPVWMDANAWKTLLPILEVGDMDARQFGA